MPRPTRSLLLLGALSLVLAGCSRGGHPEAKQAPSPRPAPSRRPRRPRPHPRPPPPGPPPPPPAGSGLGFDPAQLDRIFGRPGTVAGGLYKQSIARGEQVKMQGAQAGEKVPLIPAMGVGTVINFQPLGGGQAAITGDFALIGSEVDKVAKTLVARGVEVTAAHTHVTADEPALYYMHFFATGEATKLAEGLRAALDQTH